MGTRTTNTRRDHALDHLLVGLMAALCLVAFKVFGVDASSLDMAYHVWRDIVAAVGYRRTQVGNLQWRSIDLSLSDRDGDDRERVPTAKGVVIKLCVGNHSAALARQIDAQFVAEALRDHVVAPLVHRVVESRILFLLDNI